MWVSHFTYPGGMEARIELVCCGELNSGTTAHMSDHAWERLEPQPNELATQITS